MSDKQYQYILDLLEKFTFPTSSLITEEGRVIFEQGCDTMLMYRGHPDTLLQALTIFMATDVLPYAYAGAAQVVAAACYISGDDYDQKGIKIAEEWLAKAQAIAPRQFEINVVGLRLIKGRDSVKKQRTLLDQLGSHPDAYNNFRYALGELWYYDDVNDLAQVKLWSETALKYAQNDIQRLSVLNSLASIYMGKNKYKEALNLYHEVTKIDARDAWAWHNMAWMYNKMGEYNKAGFYNDQALNIMDFGAARQIRAFLIKRWTPSRHPDILDETPPYPVTETGRSETTSFFKKLFGS